MNVRAFPRTVSPSLNPVSRLYVSVPALGGLLFLAAVAGCDTTGAIIGGVVGVTAVGGLTPNNEIEQVYYLGVFDSQDQVPSTVYRIRVRGQAPAISFMRFGSGWVPAAMIDSLGTAIQVEKETKNITITKTGQDEFPSLPTGRKLMVFGPEGFREAPKDHRLVIVMGSDPSDFFKAIDTALGQVSETARSQRRSALDRKLSEDMRFVMRQKELIQELEENLKADRKRGPERTLP